MSLSIKHLALAGMLSLMAVATVADPLEEARAAWRLGDKGGAVSILRPLLAEGETEAEFAIGALTYFQGLKDDDDDLMEHGMSLLSDAMEAGHGEAASLLCAIFLEHTDGMVFIDVYDRVCGIAASDLGETVPDIHFNPDYPISYLVGIGRFYQDEGHDLQAASCYGSFIRNFDRMTADGRSSDRNRTELDNALKGLTSIFLQRALTGGFRGEQANDFGPFGTEPIPPCGLSSVDVGVIAGTAMLEGGLGSQ